MSDDLRQAMEREAQRRYKLDRGLPAVWVEGAKWMAGEAIKRAVAINDGADLLRIIEELEGALKS